MRKEQSLPFPSIWGFSVSGSFCLSENSGIELKDETDKHMKNTIKSLNRMISLKKNVMFFLPNRLEIESFQEVKVLCNGAKKALSIISEARAIFSNGYETYYALYTNTDKLFLFSDSFALLEGTELTSLPIWEKLRRGYSSARY
jgi:hypothetical protein